MQFARDSLTRPYLLLQFLNIFLLQYGQSKFNLEKISFSYKNQLNHFQITIASKPNLLFISVYYSMKSTLLHLLYLLNSYLNV